MAQHDSGRTGIGDDDLDEDGQADATVDQSETGGSGGAGLTRHEGDGALARAGTPDARHPARDAGARGAGDTHAEQAGNKRFGLGTPETGGNQTPADLAHPADN